MIPEFFIQFTDNSHSVFTLFYTEFAFFILTYFLWNFCCSLIPSSGVRYLMFPLMICNFKNISIIFSHSSWLYSMFWRYLSSNFTSIFYFSIFINFWIYNRFHLNFKIYRFFLNNSKSLISFYYSSLFDRIPNLI